MKLHIDETVRPVAQAARRIPFAMREKVERELQNSIDFNVIKLAKGPTPWTSPVVVVPKPNGDVLYGCSCMDMRRENKAITGERRRHPIPMADKEVQARAQP